jgi:hypothetical protein
LQEIFGFSCRDTNCGSMTCIVALLITTACGEPPPARTAVGACGTDGAFRAELYGGLELALDWQPDQLECQGMPRPNGAGARLRFAGPAAADADAPSLAFILGIPALERAETAKELPTNVTVIDEEGSRFFATRSTDSCWTDIDRNEAARISALRPDEFVVGGILYCVSPLAELHGTGSLQFTEIQFVGLIDWRQPK